MSMSKKDFIALADVIRGINPGETCPAWQDPDKFAGLKFQYDWTLKVLADFCAASNPNFMRDRWLDYIAGKVGPNGGAIKTEKSEFSDAAPILADDSVAYYQDRRARQKSRQWSRK